MSGKVHGLILAALIALAAPSLVAAGDEGVSTATAVPWSSLSSAQQELLEAVRE